MNGLGGDHNPAKGDEEQIPESSLRHRVEGHFLGTMASGFKDVPLAMYRTTLMPTVLSTAGDEPSTGRSVMVAVFRKITRLEKSPPGLVQLTAICVSPAVALSPVTSLGERLSMVTVALSVSVPSWVLVLVNAVIVPVTA